VQPPGNESGGRISVCGKDVQRQMRQTYSNGEEPQMSVLARPRFSVWDLLPADLAQKDGNTPIAVGKTHQAPEGCACPRDALSRKSLKKLQLSDGEILPVDMEAGFEHFGHGAQTSVDAVVTVVEPSLEFVVVAQKVKRVTADAGAGFVGAILNKVQSAEVKVVLSAKLREGGISVLSDIGYHEEVSSTSLAGQPVPSVADETGHISAGLLYSEPPHPDVPRTASGPAWGESTASGSSPSKRRERGGVSQACIHADSLA